MKNNKILESPSAAEIHIPTLEEIRDMLLKETPQQGESADKRSGFVNGVLDYYNLMKNRQDKLLALAVYQGGKK